MFWKNVFTYLFDRHGDKIEFRLILREFFNEIC